MKQKKNQLDNSCARCEYSKQLFEEGKFLCEKKGVVEAGYCCRKFTYDPLKRVPAKPKAPAPIEFVNIDDVTDDSTAVADIDETEYRVPENPPKADAPTDEAITENTDAVTDNGSEAEAITVAEVITIPEAAPDEVDADGNEWNTWTNGSNGSDGTQSAEDTVPDDDTNENEAVPVTGSDAEA